MLGQKKTITLLTVTTLSTVESVEKMNGLRKINNSGPSLRATICGTCWISLSKSRFAGNVLLVRLPRFYKETLNEQINLHHRIILNQPSWVRLRTKNSFFSTIQLRYISGSIISSISWVKRLLMGSKTISNGLTRVISITKLILHTLPQNYSPKSGQKLFSPRQF